MAGGERLTGVAARVFPIKGFAFSRVGGDQRDVFCDART
jgi:hypothetical protein